MSKRVKFSSQADAKLLADLRAMAKAEGRQIQVLMDEALQDLLTKRQKGRDAMAAYQASHGKYAGLYKKLAE